MARINTKDGLIQYIRTMLGEPILRVEVTDDQIEQHIDDTVQKFTEYAYGTLEDTVLVEFNGKNEYPLPDTITNIIKVSKGGSSNLTNFGANYGAGYVPNIWSEQFFSSGSDFTGNIIDSIMSVSSIQSTLEKYFGDDMYINFNPYKKTLKLFEPYVGPAIIHYEYEYLADDIDLIYNHEWVKKYSTALVKFQWGNNTGKFDQVLVGGARINYSDIKNEAQQELDVLREELITKWSDVAPILIG